MGDEAATGAGRLTDKSMVLARSFLSPVARRSRDSLTYWHNMHHAQQCVIIGNGPSLRETDLSLLRDRNTFGLNRINLLFDELGAPTTFHVAVNRVLIEQCATDFAEIQSPQFLSWQSRDHLRPGHRPTFLQSIRGPGFSTDVRSGVWEGSTVTYVAMQLAFHMGFRSVVLVGLDHRFASTGPANQLVTSNGDDPNHFDPNYFGRGFRWQLPDLVTSELAYSHARVAFERAGGEIIDATVGGACEVFVKRNLREALL